MKPRYLLFYIGSRVGLPNGRVDRDELPPKNGLLIQRHTTAVRWWHMELNEDGVYARRPATTNTMTDFESQLGYKHWAGLYPDLWLDRGGNLRGRDGAVIFLKTHETTPTLPPVLP
jgi:hypothetical protein